MSSPDTATADEPTTEKEQPEVEVEVDETREALASRLGRELGDGLVEHHIEPGRDLWVRVTREAWVDAGRACRDDLGCSFFDFLSVIDWLPSPFGREMAAEQDQAGAEAAEPEPMEQGCAGGETRFQVFARTYSITEHIGVTLKVDVPDDDLTLATWIPIYAGANWHEREAWEMYGVTFVGHPNLAHIYLPSAFEGHPQRKDFPLLARRVKPWPGIVDVEGMPGEDG